MGKLFHVIILSAGNSSRMNGIDKQIQKLSNNIEVIANTICKFNNLDCIKDIIIVTKQDLIDKIDSIIDKYKFDKVIDIVSGGNTRSQSLFNGYKRLINEVSLKSDEYCIIHDGARPLISKQDIVNCMKNAIQYRATALGVKVKDTMKLADDKKNIIKTIDRNNLYCIQTPQIFRIDILNESINNAIEHDLDFSDDCQLLEYISEKIFITDGSYTNIKITTQEDLLIANAILMSICEE